MNYQPVTDFRITGNNARVYVGKDALGNLPAEMKRNRAKRAFVLCGRTVSQKTDVITRIKALLGESFAGIYDKMGKDTPIEDIMAARDAARDCGADIIIAVGGGSAAQGGRVLAIRQRLSVELARIVKMPDVVARLANDGTIMIGSTPDQFGKYIADEASRWRKVVADTGIKLSD